MKFQNSCFLLLFLEAAKLRKSDVLFRLNKGSIQRLRLVKKKKIEVKRKKVNGTVISADLPYPVVFP